MFLEEDYIYHIYNRGNNRNPIFFSRDNYQYFIRKIKKDIVPVCEILAYCLLPNHFHFLVVATKNSIIPYRTFTGKELEVQTLPKKIGLMLSSYTQGINKQLNRTGSLFQPKTKAKALNDSVGKMDYLFLCFNYIHQNPVSAELVERLEDWPYSSFREYCGYSDDRICNIELAKELLNLDWDNFREQSYCIFNEQDLKQIF